MTGAEQYKIFRECKKSASSYISSQKFLKDSKRRLTSIRGMITEVEYQLGELKKAEAALSGQVKKLSVKKSERK